MTVHINNLVPSEFPNGPVQLTIFQSYMWRNMCRRTEEEVGPTVGLPTPKTFRRVLGRVAVVTPTDRPKSVRNCCLIELFCGVVCVVTLPYWHFCWCRAFVIGLGQISSFLSLTCPSKHRHGTNLFIRWFRHTAPISLLLRHAGDTEDTFST